MTKTKSKPTTVAGITYTSFVAAERALGIPEGIAKARVVHGWTLEEAFGLSEAPVRHRRPITVAGVEYASISKAAQAHGMGLNTVLRRLKKNVPVDDVFDAIGSQYQSKSVPVTVGKVTYLSMTAAATAHGVQVKLFHSRYRENGWTLEQALELEPPPSGRRKCMGQIYLIRHIASGKGYVGLTKSSLEKRWAQHVAKALSGKKFHPDSLQVAILRYGEDAFAISELAIGHTTCELAKIERTSIAEFDTMAPSGFNLGRGGEGLGAYTRGPPVTVYGETYGTVAAACEALSMLLSCIKRRLKSGWTPDKAFSTPVDTKSATRTITFRDKVYSSVKELLSAFGVKQCTYSYRRKCGATLEQCLGLEPMEGRKTVVTIDGERFSSIREAALAKGLNASTADRRIRAGWSIELALTTPAAKRTKLQANKGTPCATEVAPASWCELRAAECVDVEAANSDSIAEAA